MIKRVPHFQEPAMDVCWVWPEKIRINTINSTWYNQYKLNKTNILLTKKMIISTSNHSIDSPSTGHVVGRKASVVVYKMKNCFRPTFHLTAHGKILPAPPIWASPSPTALHFLGAVGANLCRWLLCKSHIHSVRCAMPVVIQIRLKVTNAHTHTNIPSLSLSLSLILLIIDIHIL